MASTYKYKAFISYRHISPDKIIAKKLQKMLEGYKPPKALGKNFTKWHLFRDETELPTSSNLSEDIKKALENSEYLIVICSKETKLSKWCMQEINYFKELHNGSNSKIITLVASGNPEEVFFEELCNELYEKLDDEGNVTYESREIEPLAANVSADSVKGSLKKLKTECLRIAAPLLGCGYDTLYNREQKKKIRRILAVSAALVSILLCFGIYNSAMLWQIKSANYELRLNNSQMLSEKAAEQLANGDNYSAAKTALEALPLKGEKIPINPVAEGVVAEAIGAYNSENKMVKTKINLSGYVDFLEFSADGTRLLSKDSAGNVYVIDYEKNEIIKTYTPFVTFGDTNGIISDICVDKNTGYVLCDDQLLSIDLKSGEINWHYNKDDNNFTWLDKIVTNNDSNRILLAASGKYVVLDKTGKLICSAEYGDNPYYRYNNFNDGIFMDENGTVYVAQMEDGLLVVLNENESRCFDIGAKQNDEVLAIGGNDECVLVNIALYDEDSFVYKNAKLVCFNKSDMSIKWERKYSVEEILSTTGFNEIFDYTLIQDQKEVDVWLFVSSYHFLCFKKDTGELYFKNELKDEKVLFCKPNIEEYSIRYGTQNGFANNAYFSKETDINSFLYGENVIATNGYTFDEERKYVAQAEGDRFALASEASSEISMYHKMSFNNLNLLNYETDSKYSINAVVDDGNGVIAVAKDESVEIFDTEANRLLATTEMDRSIRYAVFVNNKLFVIDREGIGTVLTYSGEKTAEIDLVAKIKEAAGIDESKYISVYLSYLKAFEKKILICIEYGIYIVDLSEDIPKVEKVLYKQGLKDFCVDEDFVSFSQDDYSNAMIIACFKEDDEKLKYVSENNVPVEFARESVFSIINSTENNTVAFINKEGYIGLYQYDREEFVKIPMEETPLKIKFTPDNSSLIVMCSNGKFVRYSLKTKMEEADYIAAFEVSESTEFEFMDERNMYIRRYTSADEITIVNYCSMEKVTTVGGFWYYLKPQRKILEIQYADNAYRIGYFNYFTIEELSEKAKIFLGEK